MSPTLKLFVEQPQNMCQRGGDVAARLCASVSLTFHISMDPLVPQVLIRDYP